MTAKFPHSTTPPASAGIARMTAFRRADRSQPGHVLAIRQLRGGSSSSALVPHLSLKQSFGIRRHRPEISRPAGKDRIRISDGFGGSRNRSARAVHGASRRADRRSIFATRPRFVSLRPRYPFARAVARTSKSQSVGRGAMLRLAPLQNDLTLSTSPVPRQGTRRRQADKYSRAGVGRAVPCEKIGKTETVSLSESAVRSLRTWPPRPRRTVLFQSLQEILRFPGRQGRIDFQPGKRGALAGYFPDSDEFLLEQRFGVTERPWIQLAISNAINGSPST